MVGAAAAWLRQQNGALQQQRIVLAAARLIRLVPQAERGERVGEEWQRGEHGGAGNPATVGGAAHKLCPRTFQAISTGADGSRGPIRAHER